jgi:hypothetical protein
MVFVCIVTYNSEKIIFIKKSSFLGWENNFLIAVAFFCANLGTAIYYLGPKYLLLLTGADLNGNFQIVKRDKDAKKISDQLKQKVNIHRCI